jgi:hypothetical protein
MAQDKTISSARSPKKEYAYGFVTDIESELAPKGLNEDIVRFISAKKNEPEWLLEWRLSAYRNWLKMTEPTWALVNYPKIDYQDAYYYSAPEEEARTQQPRRGRPRADQDLREAGHFTSRTKAPGRAWPWMWCSTA